MATPSSLLRGTGIACLLALAALSDHCFLMFAASHTQFLCAERTHALVPIIASKTEEAVPHAIDQRLM